MQTTEKTITKNSTPVEPRAEKVNGANEPPEGRQLINTRGNGIANITTKHQNRMIAASKGLPIPVSEQQFTAVREETLASLNLLNLSGNVLLSAMDSMVPHAESGRTIGEYSAQGIRQIAKSICDVVITKNSVIRQMHSIARDDF